jgi:hypothetical protein
MQDKIDLKNVLEWGYLVNKILNNRDINTEKEKDWKILNKYFKELSSYFLVMQYELHIDETNWFAYIDEIEDMENESISKKQKLSFWVTLLLVILREFIYKKEVEDIYVDPYIVSLSYINENLIVYLNEKFDNDDKKISTEIRQIINKTIDLWIITEKSNDTYKINKLIKSKMSVDNMKEVLDSIKNELGIVEKIDN